MPNTLELVKLELQLNELRRERLCREAVYPRLVLAGKLSPASARARNSCLDAAITTLEALVTLKQNGIQLAPVPEVAGSSPTCAVSP